MKLLRLIRKNLLRRRMRTLFTLAGVASAMLLFVSIECLSAGMDLALNGSESAKTLIVYRENRYCPQTSHLPENYARRIERVSGVTAVLPVKVYLNNCRTNLDMITFHGTPVERLFGARQVNVLEGDVEQFKREKDSALVGRAFAKRRGLEVGDKFQFGRISVKVAGIFGSPEPTEEGVVLTHLEYLQRAESVNRLGTVTQFEVKVDDASRVREISREIDTLFATAEEPTFTRPQIEFLGDAMRDIKELLRFGRIFGLVCVIVVLALVANTVVMSVQDRVKEFGVFMTLGFKGYHVVALVVGEAMILSVLGTALGIGGSLALLAASDLTLGVEGVQVQFTPTLEVLLKGTFAAVAGGVLAAVFPAWRAARRDTVEALRSVA